MLYNSNFSKCFESDKHSLIERQSLLILSLERIAGGFLSFAYPFTSLAAS
jgi:hypothetical protein